MSEFSLEEIRKRDAGWVWSEVWLQPCSFTDRRALIVAYDALSDKCSSLLATNYDLRKERDILADHVRYLLDALKANNIHVEKSWCWCGPVVEDHRENERG